MTRRANEGLNSSEEREGQQMVPAHGRNQMHGPDRRYLQLRFQSLFPDSFFTERNVEGQGGAPINVKLIDTSTGLVVRSGPESCVKLKVVVVEGDFNNEDDDDDWTQEVFESRVVKEREGKRPLLIGNLYVRLEGGVGSLGKFSFTDNSSWTRSKKFRLGVKVASGLREGIHVLEAITNPFVVKDCRGEVYKKHNQPALDDEVWRLKKIRKNGPFHKRLNDNEIFIVKDFLWLLGTDPKRLRKILGSNMREKMWDALVEHAKTCDLRGKHYVYYADNTKQLGVVFESICELSGYIAGGKYYSAETLSDSQKVSADSLKREAYAKWRDIVEYESLMLMDMNPKKRARLNEAPDQQVPPPHQVLEDSGPVVGGGVGYDENLGNRYAVHSHRSNTQMQLESNAVGWQMQLMSSCHQSQITRNDHMIGSQPESASCFGFQSIRSSDLPSNLISYDDQSAGYNNNRGADEFFSEEMLENDDVQQLPYVFSTEAAPANSSNDGYPYSSFIQSPSTNFNFEESSGKVVVGWLKLKGALRWDIFIREKAAERRAQLVELED